MMIELTAMMIELTAMMIELTAMLIDYFCLASATPCHPQHAVCRRAIDNLCGCEIARERPPPSARPVLLVTVRDYVDDVVVFAAWAAALLCSPLGWRRRARRWGRRCRARRSDDVVVLAVGVVVLSAWMALSCSTSPAGILTGASVTLLSERGGRVDSTGVS
ncbi:hypothetical protein BD626DRAFT_100067 [Schizophyllum amplum]|uniref:Uncharacterized protein n=1 Tax=Schizophyllum amplum TaxID=97359 RepID=A0A550CRI8_9AGAR|nr:hypothetical protein BD626DRAFT_100067 [Auriculariopsis ampla]